MHLSSNRLMKIDRTKLIIGTTILAIGIILASPVLAGLEEVTQMPQLYIYDAEKSEYVSWIPPGYDPENRGSYVPEECPWWDLDGDGAFDWMPHWGRRWSYPNQESNGYGRE